MDPNVVKRGEAIRANDEALKDLIIHLSPDTVFDLANYVRNPADPGGGVVTPVILLSYLVPSAFILKINKIGITYSNPVVAMSQAVGWRVTINGDRVPNIVQTTDGYMYSSFGEVNSPLEIEPLWVQSNQTIAIEVYPRFGFNQQLTISGRLSGQIYKPATARLIGSTV
jgi:hypothetical protein